MTILFFFLTSGCPGRTREVVIGGGPVGGTYQPFARGLATILQDEDAEIHYVVERSGGSLANLRGVEEGDLDMALVNAGDAYLSSRGRLESVRTSGNLRALARIYGTSAQLAVIRHSPVRTPFDLRGRRVAIGSPGSGAAQSAERFFRTIGIWESIVPIHIGYTMAVKDLERGSVQAVWELVGVPSSSLSEAGRRFQLRLLDLHAAAAGAGFYDDYPFYTPAIIPAGTYHGQERDIATFQDSVLWVAATDLDAELVFRSLTRLFSDRGLERMRQLHPVAADLDRAKGLLGIQIPLHPGARRFWSKQGVSSEQ